MQKNWILLGLTNPGDELPKYQNFYCSLVVWTWIDLPKILLWPPLSPRFPESILLPLLPQSNVFHKTLLEIELMSLKKTSWHAGDLSNIFNIAFINLFICQPIFFPPVWKVPWIICREQDPMFIVNQVFIRFFQYIPICAWTINGNLNEFAFL